jgi:hypothetical protein
VLELVTSSMVPEGPTNPNVADSAVPSWLTLQTLTSFMSVANGQAVPAPMFPAVPQFRVTPVAPGVPASAGAAVIVTVPERTQPTVSVPVMAIVLVQVASAIVTTLVPRPVTQAWESPPVAAEKIATPAGVAVMVVLWAPPVSTLTVSVALPPTGAELGAIVMLVLSADTGRSRLIMP